MATANFLEDGDVSFEVGMDSNSHPIKLPPGKYARGENIVNRGGIVQCRPGYRCLTALPEGRLQGFSVFRPKVGPEQLLFMVEGLLYVADFPFSSFRQVAGVSFSSAARQGFFAQVEQAVQSNPDGSLTLVTPKNLLVIQDGGFTPPAVYDGTRATHQRGPSAIPMGGPMRWIADRLWVGRGAELFASDINNPISFIEDVYLATVRAFVLPGEITALARNPTVEFAQLLVYTEDSTSLIQAGIRDRTQWPTTPNMQQEIFPKIGCKGQRSVIDQQGMLWWYSSLGFVSLDSATNAKLTSKLPYRDSEMMESKARLSEDLSGIAAGTFENYIMLSVPYADKLNRHTWVMDNSVRQNYMEDTPPTWNSYWTGTRPVQWINDQFHGKERVLYISADYDGVNRLWEAFVPDRKDEGCPISWWFETRGLFGAPTSVLTRKSFRYADLYLSEMAGDVDIGVFWAGTRRGKYKKILNSRYRATEGCFRPDTEITMNSQIFGFKKQSRVVRTQDAKDLSQNETEQSCGVESPWEDFFDESFQILVAGSGPCAVDAVRMVYEPPVSRDNLLRTDGCENETEENVVRFDGAASESDNEAEAWKELSGDILEFTSTRSTSVTNQGFTEIAVGDGRSIISQSDADKVALAVATRKASHKLEAVLPLVVSLGESANE
jgi:hypothetical protein